MPEPSEVLREEHKVIEHLLHVVNGMADRLDHRASVPRADLDAVLDVVVNFADKCHHAKEEKALFPTLAAASPKEGALLVHRLEGDHAAGRHLVAALRSALPAMEAGDPKARAQFVKNARTYASLLSEHIDQETKRLLPLIDRVLPPQQRASLGEELDRIEREEIGARKHEAYEGTIHRLAVAYVHNPAP